VKKLLCLLLFASIAYSGQAKELILREQTHINSSFIRLSQLIPNGQEAQKYHDVFLGKAPPLDQTKHISLTFIRDRLRRDGFLTVRPITRSGADHISVKTLRAEKQTSLAPPPPAKTSSIREDSQSHLIKSKGKLFPYLTIKKDMRRGTLLSPEMVEISHENRFIDGGFSSPNDIIGFRLERSLPKGAVLNKRHTSIPPTIERGATIKIILRQPGIEISGIAKSIGEGKVGDTIEVRRNNETLSGTIIDPHTVLIQ
jgi:flagella basal body P-ring formation protein FlgA